MTYFLIIVIIAGLAALKSPYVKSVVGEAIIRTIIGKSSPGQKYVINNLMLETAPGKTSQIDHVVIKPTGVFVIETKNYSGRIYGNESQMQWTQVLNYGKTKYHFYSPVKQNQTHIHAIRKLLNQDAAIYSIVVFVKGNIKHIQSSGVYTIWGLIQKLNVPSEKPISPEQMNLIYATLLNNNKRNTISNSEHIGNIRLMKNNIANNICPRCGGALVLRHGKNGSFMGCSQFPHCRFTKKIN